MKTRSLHSVVYPKTEEKPGGGKRKSTEDIGGPMREQENARDSYAEYNQKEDCYECHE